MLAAAVNETRSSLPNPSGAFLQLDGHCEVQNSVNGSSMHSIEDLQTLVVVNNEPIEMNKASTCTYMNVHMYYTYIHECPDELVVL